MQTCLCKGDGEEIKCNSCQPLRVSGGNCARLFVSRVIGTLLIGLAVHRTFPVAGESNAECVLSTVGQGEDMWCGAYHTS